MHGDFSLNPLAYHEPVSRFLGQQGRVQLDSDFNGQTEALLRYLRALGSDLIGFHGGLGTAFQLFSPNKDGKREELSIHWGPYYVDGIRCLNYPTGTFAPSAQPGGALNTGRPAAIAAGYPATIPIIDIWSVIGYPNEIKAIGDGLRIVNQPDYTWDPKNPGVPEAQPILFYLDVFERHISSAQDDSIREVALLGPDTDSRAVIVWQVRTRPFADVEVLLKVLEGVIPKDWDANYIALNLLLRSGGRLAAQAIETEATDPCIISADARYRGVDNRLYCVEIHDPGDPQAKNPPKPATFKWSPDNGAIVYPIRDLQGKVVHLDSLGRDDRTAIMINDWVEVVDDDVTLNERVHPLLQVVDVQRSSMTVTLSAQPEGNAGTDPAKHPILRRWASNEIPIREAKNAHDGWYELSDGVEVQFTHVDLLSDEVQKKAGGNLKLTTWRAGDYWLVPARTATGDVIWPSDTDAKGTSVPLAVPPHGVEHHFAPLGTINPVGEIHDLRYTFDAYAKPAP